MKKILLAGATGFVGNHLVSFLLKNGHSIHVLTRRKYDKQDPNLSYFHWDIERQFIDPKAFENVNTIINLTGTNIGKKKWTKARKAEIIASRIHSTNLLYRFVKENQLNIDTYVSSSAVGYYGAITTVSTFNENTPNGTDFLAEVCKKWEEAAFQFLALGTRVIVLRKGVVIAKDGGMYQKLSPLAKLGINVALGSGKQYLPWIAIQDLVSLYEFVLTHHEISGVYNAVATAHITMNDFSKTLLQSFGKRRFFPNVPRLFIQILFGEMAVMLLEGSRVSNQKLSAEGFQFEFDQLKNAL